MYNYKNINRYVYLIAGIYKLDIFANLICKFIKIDTDIYLNSWNILLRYQVWLTLNIYSGIQQGSKWMFKLDIGKDINSVT